MNQITFQLPIKPISINKKFTLHKRSRFIIKSPEAQSFEKKINLMLNDFEDLFNELRDNYKQDKHAISFDLEVFVPQHEFFTKKQTINQRCLDVTNAFKMLEDIIFKRIGIDDSQIVQASAGKFPWARETWSCIVKIKIIPAPKSSYLQSVL